MTKISGFHKLILGATLLTLSLSLASYSGDGAERRAKWSSAGQDVRNWRSQPAEHQIRPSNVAALGVKWTFTTGGDVSATPTVDGDLVYFPDWGGNLFAVRTKDGSLLWSRKISDYDGFAGAVSRVSPALHGDDLIIGDLQSPDQPHNGAWVIAIDAQTGTLRWKTQVDPHIAAIITGPPVVFGDVVYVGVSSTEEALAANPTYPCCSFRGSMVALNADTGAILWQMFTMPDNRGRTDGYSGGGIWQTPAIDLARGSLYVGTGNNYEAPDAVKACLATATMQTQSDCFSPEDRFDAALALDLHTGQIKWSRRLQGFDVWTVACISNPTPVSCPEPTSPDFDLGGSGPNLLPNIVGFGQKSGIYWALNPADGSVVWSTVVGPGAMLGGIQWGTATDGRRIYAAITNSSHLPYALVNGTTITWGAWSALDAATGKILWQTADPAQAVDMGAVSVANGVVYAPSLSGNMHGLEASTGRILFTFGSGGSVIDSPSIVNGTVYWGSGYQKAFPGTGNNKVYAFSLKRGIDR